MINQVNSFFFITTEVEFQEATKKGARILATFMELDTPSQNGRIYRFVEGKKIAKSLIGRYIKFGASWIGKHLKKVPKIGIVESAFQKGKKIKGIVRIWDKGIIKQLKRGVRFLFSVGGVAQFGEIIQKGKQFFTKLHNAVCTHLQLLPNDPDGAGFPTAKMHKIIEINESFMMTDETLKICNLDGKCRILNGIKNEFEEALAIEEKIIHDIVIQDIARITRIIMKEPWLFFEEET